MKRYNTIYVDPPWTTPGWTIRAVERLPIKEIAVDDALIALWPIMVLLPECIELLYSWGFRFGTMVTWRKGMDDRSPRHGYCDHMLLGAKGVVSYSPMLRYELHDVLKPKGRKKPVYFRDLLEKTGSKSFQRPTYLDVFGRFWQDHEGLFEPGPWDFIDEDVLRMTVGNA